MKEIKRMISRISGHRNRESYAILSYAVDVARRYQPQEPKMETIVSEVAEMLGQRKGTAAISRSLSRVAMDIWEFGNRRELERILGRHLEEPPTPRELVLRLAEYLWIREESPESAGRIIYRCCKSLAGAGYGITVTLQDTGYRAATGPFCGDAELADRLVRLLNECQVPLEIFEERYLENSLLSWLEAETR